nr:putative B3 domain-containing protein At2g27410 [Tanacetum cinerariifolium]
MPFRKLETEDFLMTEEKLALENENEIEVRLVGPTLKMYKEPMRLGGSRGFGLRPTGDVLPWPGNANMAFDLRPTEDVLPWPDNANMAFDLRPTGDVLPWPGNANIAFDLRSTGDVLSWPAPVTTSSFIDHSRLLKRK